MPGIHSFLNCFSCRNRKARNAKKAVNQNGARCADGLINSPSDTDSSQHKPNDGSAKETVSLSTTSQTHGIGDPGSASLGGWSVTQQPVDGYDAVSKVNLVPSEDSGSAIRPLLGVGFNRSGAFDIGDDYLERFESLLGRLERIAGMPEKPVDDAGLQAFQRLIDNVLPLYTTLSRELGPEIKLQSGRVEAAFLVVKNLIKYASEFSKPPVKLLDDYYRPLAYKLLEISDFDHKHPDILTRYALALVSDSTMALAWGNCQSASIFVKEICEAANAFANKIFQYCHSNQTKHAEWIRSWMACIRGLQDVVNEHFRHGLIWNPAGSKPPPAPQVPRPALLYEQQTSCTKREASNSAARSNGLRPKPKPLFKSCDTGHQYTSHQELLLEISKTRDRLHHVRNPELWQ